MSKKIKYGAESFTIVNENRFTKSDGKKYLRYDIKCTHCGANYYGVIPKELLKENFVCIECGIVEEHTQEDLITVSLEHHPHLHHYKLLLTKTGELYGVVNKHHKALTPEMRQGKSYGYKILKRYYSNCELLALVVCD